MSGNSHLPGFAERHTEARGVRLRWFEAGAGPVVVLVHGLGGAASNWTLVAHGLTARCRVVVPDLPGHGGSTALPAPAETLDPYADRVAALLDEPAVLAGHSTGGLTALRLAARHPRLVRGLLLAAPSGIGSSTRRSARYLALVGVLRPAQRISPLAETIGRRPRLRRLVFGPVAVADPRAFRPAAVGGFLSGSAEYTDFRSAARALVASDPRLDLERVRCPALVLHGARDPQVPLRDGFEYARRLRAPVRVVADCGHLLIGERPAAVVDAIEALLDRVREVDELPRDAEPLG
jgi:pimeloyl-ACP methyl ester carboxylesterase